MRLAFTLGAALACASAVAQPLPWDQAIARTLSEHGAAVRRDPILIETEFFYRPDQPAESVHLTGDFANWEATAIPLQDDDGDGVWTVAHRLRAGSYLYKFVVNGTQWVSDPNNPERIDDGHDGFNSVIQVAGGHVEDVTASRNGRVESSILYHDTGSDAGLRRTAPSSIQVTMRTARGDVDSVTLLAGAGDPPRSVSAEHIYSDDLFDYHRSNLDLTEEESRANFGYLFEVRDGADVVRLGANGGSRESEGEILPFVARPVDLPFDTVPNWAAEMVWYQIFPEVFRNGDPANDLQPPTRWTIEYTQPQNDRERQEFYKYVYERKFGGDLQGVIWALDHLKDLGFTGIYLNPIFEAESLHKYETSDYRHVDDNFGVIGDNKALSEELDPSTWVLTPSDQVFFDLIREAHARGMRVIIDGVFNHTGRMHWAFQDVMQNGQSSPFADWYKVASWEPFEYEGWAGEPDLPEWSQTEEGLVRPVAEHIFDITRRWMDPNSDGDPSDGIDGWRLDVPNEIPKPFWREWNALVRQINPNAYTVGELWGRNSDWTEPELFDAHMNYEWLRGVFRFFINTDPNGSEPVYSPSEFNRYLFELQDAYGTETAYAMQNLLDSHDTDRIASAIMNPNRPVDAANRVQEPAGQSYNRSKPTEDAYRRVRLIQTFQFTAIGAPMVWYGDEVGMWGADDPECRKPMLWEDLQPYDNSAENQVDLEMQRHVRALCHLRGALPALRNGLLRPALLDDERNVYAFERRLSPAPSLDDVYVVLNRSGESATVEVPVHWPEGTLALNALDSELAGEETELTPVAGGALAVTLGPDEGAIFTAKR